MKQESTGSLLSTVFVDYDNIYLSLKRKNEEAAKRFAKGASTWISAIANGGLITPTNGIPLSMPRRIVMNRCYGNPVPRRNSKDNATDMNSFPFVRHHYLRAGFEVIDCPPLTAQLKNSADIRMVMDVRDYLLHETYFDEFIILSGDADFTPVLHRLRAHARRTVIYANDYTAAPYKAISDGEIRESDLIALLTGGAAQAGQVAAESAAQKGLPSPETLTETRTAIINEVLATVRASKDPVPLEALADRAVRVLGHDNTVGTAWGGTGSFRDLLAGGLPESMKLSEQAPYYVFDSLQQGLPAASAPATLTPPAQPAPTRAPQVLASQVQPAKQQPEPEQHQHLATSTAPTASQQGAPDLGQHRFAASNEPETKPVQAQAAPAQPTTPLQSHTQQFAPSKIEQSQAPRATTAAPLEQAKSHQPASAPPSDSATVIQQSIARIHEACQAPALSPPEYRVLFEVMAAEIKTNGLTGARTLVNIVQTSQELGVNLRRDDARFILEVVSEADPWFEHGSSANLFASRFRNFVVARCRSQGLHLSADELDLIDAWFSGTTQGGQIDPGAGGPRSPGGNPTTAPGSAAPGIQASQPSQPQAGVSASTAGGAVAQGNGPGNGPGNGQGQDPFGAPLPKQAPTATTSQFHDDDEFPRIIRARG